MSRKGKKKFYKHTTDIKQKKKKRKKHETRFDLIYKKNESAVSFFNVTRQLTFISWIEMEVL